MFCNFSWYFDLVTQPGQAVFVRGIGNRIPFPECQLLEICFQSGIICTAGQLDAAASAQIHNLDGVPCVDIIVRLDLADDIEDDLELLRSEIKVAATDDLVGHGNELFPFFCYFRERLAHCVTSFSTHYI